MFYYLLINFSSLLHSFLFKFQLYFDVILVGEIHKLALSRNDIYLDIIEFYQMIWEFCLDLGIGHSCRDFPYLGTLDFALTVKYYTCIKVRMGETK